MSKVTRSYPYRFRAKTKQDGCRGWRRFWRKEARIVASILFSMIILGGAPDAKAILQDGAEDPEAQKKQNEQTDPVKNDKKKGDPVILSTGNFDLSETDLAIPGRGMDFEFTRSYRSGAATKGHLGSKWDHNWNQFIVVQYKLKPNPGYSGPPDPVIQISRAGSLITPVTELPNGEPSGGDWSIYEQSDTNTTLQSIWSTAGISQQYWIAELGNAYYYNGGNRIDAFTKPVSQFPAPFAESAVGEWGAPPGYNAKLRANAGSGAGSTFSVPVNFVMRMADGTKYTFGVVDQYDPFVVGTIYRLSKVEDRNGNRITVLYDNQAVYNDSYPNGVVYKAVSSVVDTMGRAIIFNYGATYQGGQIIRTVLTDVVDFHGRTVKFAYNPSSESGIYLKTVTSPSILGTSTGNDFPTGRTTAYGYNVSNYLPFQVGLRRLSGIDVKLTSITRPEEYASAGPSFLTNEYVQNRVSRQIIGGVNSSGVPSGGSYRFLYEILPQGQPISHGNGIIEASRTLTIDPNGNVALTIFDASGNPSVEWRFTGRIDPDQITNGTSIGNLVAVDPSSPDGSIDQLRATAPGYSPAFRVGSDPSSFVTFKEFDAGGLVTQIKNESSLMLFDYYDGPDVFQSSNLIRQRRYPVPDDGSEPLTTVSVYEPYFNKIRAVYPEIGLDGSFAPSNGGTAGADPHRYETRYIYDYQEGGVAGSALEVEANLWGVDAEQSCVDAIYDLYGIGIGSVESEGPVGDQNGDGLVGEQSGNLVKVIEPTVSKLLNPIDSSSNFTSQVIEESYTYNSFGLRSAWTDPSGYTTKYSYNSEADPDGDGVSTPGLLDQNSGTNGGGYLSEEESPEAVVIKHGYDPLGRVNVNTHTRGVTEISSYREWNASDEIVAQVDELGFRREFHYDANGNLVLTRQENKTQVLSPDGSLGGAMVDSISGPFTEDSFKYDIQGNVVEVDAQVSAQVRAITKHRYDKLGNKVISFLPMWPSDPSNYITKVYDERNLLWMKTEAGFAAAFAAVFADGDIPERTGLVSSSDASTEVYNYNLAGGLSETVDPEGKTYSRNYDSYNRLWESVDPLGNKTRFTYRADGELKTSESFDDSGKLLSRITFDYDEVGRVFQTNKDLFLVDNEGGPLSEGPLTPNDGKVTSRLGYDPSDNVIVSVNDESAGQFFGYDKDDRLTSVTDSVGNTVTLGYGASGLLNVITETVVDDSGIPQLSRTTRKFYNAAGWLIAEVDELGNTSRQAYNSRGQIAHASDARSEALVQASTLDTYNEHPGLTGMVNGPGNPISYIYDDRGLLVSSKSYLLEGGAGANSLAASSPFSDSIVVASNTFDLNGRLKTKQDDAGNVTTFAYDSLNRIKVESDVDGLASQYMYNKRGQAMVVITPRGDSIANVFDDAGRLVTRVIQDYSTGVVENEFVTYDGLGRPITASNAFTDVELHYDSLGRVVVDSIDGDRTLLSWNSQNNLTGIKSPSGRDLQRQYDSRGLLTSVSDNSSVNHEVQFEYVGRSYRSVNYPNGNKVDWQYDAILRPTSLVVSNAASVVLENKTFAWDGNGNRISREDVKRDRQLFASYDSLNRLATSSRVSEAILDETIDYAYDDGGSRRMVSGGQFAGVSTLIPSGGAALTSAYSASPPFISLDYDPNGNLTQRTESSSDSLEYDWQNRLIRFSSGQTGLTWDYRYDVFGRRVRRLQGTVEDIEYRYVGHRLLEECDNVGSTDTTFIFGDSDSETLAALSEFGAQYFHLDDLNSVICVSDSQGGVTASIEYSDYGLPLDADSFQPFSSYQGLPTLHLFTGQKFDPESEMYYMRSRYYDPKMGRFVSRDPGGAWFDPFGYGNPYTYVGNNPWTLIDPDGRKAKKPKRPRRWKWLQYKAKQAARREARRKDRAAAERRRQFESAVRNAAEENPDLAYMVDLINQVPNPRMPDSKTDEGKENLARGSEVTRDLFGNAIEATETREEKNQRIAREEGELTRQVLEYQAGRNTSDTPVGQPGFWESWLPIWGPARSSIDHFQNGNYWSGLGMGALAVTDAFGVGIAFKGIVAGVRAVRAVRFGKGAIRGFRGSVGKNIFHGLDRAIERGVSPKAILDAVRNPSVMQLQGRGRMLFLTPEAAVVLDKAGQVVTIWGRADHSAKTWALLQKAGAIK